MTTTTTHTTTPLKPVYSPITTLMLYLTEDCNLRCTYCFVEKKSRRMSLETAHKTVDYFLSRAVSGASTDLAISFFGGEPFLELELMQAVVDYARTRHPDGKRIRFSATTNGTIATPAVLSLIRDTAMSLMVSLDGGAEANRHRPFVSGRPSFEAVAKNLPKLQEAAAGTVVRMTFHPQALDLVGNVRAVVALGAQAIALCPVVEADWGPHLDALEDAYQALEAWCLDEVRAGRPLPLAVTRHLLRTWHAHLHGGQGRPDKPCGVATWMLGVDPDGHVMPCHRFLYRPQDWLGTVDSQRLSGDRWQYVHTRSSDILGCDTCPAAPVCGGGCRVLALMAGNGLHGTHPGHCDTMRAHARMARRLYDTLKRERPHVLTSIVRGSSVQHPALSEIFR